MSDIAEHHLLLFIIHLAKVKMKQQWNMFKEAISEPHTEESCCESDWSFVLQILFTRWKKTCFENVYKRQRWLLAELIHAMNNFLIEQKLNLWFECLVQKWTGIKILHCGFMLVCSWWKRREIIVSSLGRRRDQGSYKYRLSLFLTLVQTNWGRREQTQKDYTLLSTGNAEFTYFRDLKLSLSLGSLFSFTFLSLLISCLVTYFPV